MGLANQIANYYVEIIAFAVFLIALYRIIEIVYSEPLTLLWHYIAIAILMLFLMNYRNIPHQTMKALRKKN